MTHLPILEELDSDGAIRETAEAVDGDTRASFLRKAGVGAGAIAGSGAILGALPSVAGAAGIAVHLTLSEDPARLPADAEAELLRIAQEAVSNARKHANARNLWVRLEVDPPHALLRVEDDGQGIDTGARRGFGLEIMRERTERLGATLRVTHRSPTGTCVEVEIGGATG